MNSKFKIFGVVVDDNGQGIADLMIQAYDRDFMFDDLLGNAKTDSNGRFEIRYNQEDFSELFEKTPDVYLKVFDSSGNLLLLETTDCIRFNAKKEESFKLKIPSIKGNAEPNIAAEQLDQKKYLKFLNTQGDTLESYEAGDSLMVEIGGLPNNAGVDIKLMDDGEKEVFQVSLRANRFGVIAPTVLWPDMGIGVPEKGGPYAFETFEEAADRLAGRAFKVQVLLKKEIFDEGKFIFTDGLKNKKVYPANKSGVLQRGLFLGKDELRIQGRNFAPGSIVDLYLVERRFNWEPGQTMTPVLDEEGEAVMTTVKLDGKNTDFNVLLWPAEQLRAGSYDIIARPTMDFEYKRNALVLKETDIVSDKFISSLVVRTDIYHYKPVWNGCVMATKEIAAKMLWGVPEEVKYTNNFPKGTDVWAALDPAGLMPTEIGKKIRYYVVQHKTPAQWASSSNLSDVTGTTTEIITSASCVNANAALVWSNPQTAGQYDLVVDFGNNAPNPANFVADNSFDPPMDMIDGYFNVGFHVTDDPSLPGTYPVGSTNFNDPAVTIPAVGVWAPPPWNWVGDTASGTLSLPMVAEVRYPATSAGTNTPVSNAQSSFPVVVIMHGMHTTADPSWEGYTYLLEHLASHGFIALSIDCNAINAIGGMQDTRAHAMLEHLALLQTKNTTAGLFNGKIDMNNIGIMGHSRGGDGVVQAEIWNQGLATPFNIRAVVPLAPTDFSGIAPAPLNLTSSNLCVLYGANDGDVWGGSNPATQYTGTGFRFYDRATVEKSMLFIYGATHNRFNTEWGTESRVDASSPKILSTADHHTLLKGYMTAIMQVYLQGRTEQKDYLTGDLKIPQVSSLEVHAQYRPASGSLVLDDFETNPATNLNSLGGAVAVANLNGAPQEDPLGTIDGNSPHVGRGLKLAWNANTATYQSVIPLAGTNRDLTGKNYISFRVSQKVASALNPANQLQDLRLRLTTAGGGNSRAIRVGYFNDIPFPYHPEYSGGSAAQEGPNTKAALKTIRIPLYAWTIKCLNVPIVDLSDVEHLTFEFTQKPTGELEFEDIEFTS